MFVYFEPSFKAFESFNLVIFPEGHYFFCHIFLNIGTTLRAKSYSWRQTPKREKWCRSPEEHFGRKPQGMLNVLNIFQKQL